MKFYMNIFYIGCISLFFVGCASSSFEDAQRINTIQGYENFIAEYPKETKYIYKARLLRQKLLSPKQLEYETKVSDSLIQIKIVDRQSKEVELDKGDLLDNLIMKRDGIIIKTEFNVIITSIAQHNNIKGSVDFKSVIETTTISEDLVTKFRSLMYGRKVKDEKIDTNKYTDTVHFKLAPGESMNATVRIGSTGKVYTKELIGGSKSTSKLKSFSHEIYSKFDSK